MTLSTRLCSAIPLVLALATVFCGGAAERPEPPSPPPIQAEPAREGRPAPAAPTPAARENEVRPVPVSETVDAAPVTPTPVERTEAAAVAAPPPPDPDPLQRMEDRKAREESDRVRLAAAEKAVADARARVAELESRLLAVKNPFLPRPALPPEEAAAWEGLDGVARAKRVERQLVDARSELDRAENALAALRSR